MVIPNAARAEVSTVILNNDVADVCDINLPDLYIKNFQSTHASFALDLPLY